MYLSPWKNGRIKGRQKPFVIDVAAIPTEQGMDLEKWLYFFDQHGIAFVNSNHG